MSGEITINGSALFAGAHPDDVEIGAGGTIAKLVNAGCDVWLCILTTEQEKDIARMRKDETLRAAAALGVPSAKVIFLDLPDTNLRCSGETVRTMRDAMRAHDCQPDIVFTHSSADSHKDHREAHDIVRSTFRNKPLLLFGVINSLIESEFEPKVLVNVSDTFKQKLAALLEHSSQSSRIKERAIESLARSYASRMGSVYAEGFEVLIQEGATQYADLITRLNDCPFNSFWHTLLHGKQLVIIHAVPVYRLYKRSYTSTDKDREGLSLLQRTFNELWFGRSPIDDYSCDAPSVKALLDHNNILLSGGSVSNSITRNYFTHFRGIRFVDDYYMPDYIESHILDRLTLKKIYPTYRDNSSWGVDPALDFGILTIMQNPMSRDHCLIGCMGIHGFGTLACYKVISDPRLLDRLMALIELPLSGAGYQILVQYDVRTEEVKLLPRTLYAVKA